MRYKTIVAASAAAAAAAAIPCGAASASTPDWLTLVSVESDQPSLLPAVCGAEATGTPLDPACAGILGAERSSDAEAFGHPVPEVPEAPDYVGGMPALANADLRDFAKWEVCGVAVGATTHESECESSTTVEPETVDADNGVSLVNADITGAFNWSVCGITVLSESMVDC